MQKPNHAMISSATWGRSVCGMRRWAGADAPCARRRVPRAARTRPCAPATTPRTPACAPWSRPHALWGSSWKLSIQDLATVSNTKKGKDNLNATPPTPPQPPASLPRSFSHWSDLSDRKGLKMGSTCFYFLHVLLGRLSYSFFNFPFFLWEK